MRCSVCRKGATIRYTHRGDGSKVGCRQHGILRERDV